MNADPVFTSLATVSITLFGFSIVAIVFAFHSAYQAMLSEGSLEMIGSNEAVDEFEGLIRWTLFSSLVIFLYLIYSFVISFVIQATEKPQKVVLICFIIFATLIVGAILLECAQRKSASGLIFLTKNMAISPLFQLLVSIVLHVAFVWWSIELFANEWNNPVAFQEKMIPLLVTVIAVVSLLLLLLIIHLSYEGIWNIRLKQIHLKTNMLNKRLLNREKSHDE